MQYTGLKDKNGKEVFEDDIVMATFRSLSFMAKIVFNEDVAAFQISYPNVHNHFVNDHIWKYGLAVMGNIYENKNLLK